MQEKIAIQSRLRQQRFLAIFHVFHTINHLSGYTWVTIDTLHFVWVIDDQPKRIWGSWDFLLHALSVAERPQLHHVPYDALP